MAFLRCSLLWQRLISKAILSKHYHMINLICKTKSCKYKSHSFGCFHLWAVGPTFVLQWSHPLVDAHGNQNLPSHVERPGGKQLGLHKYGIPTVSNGYHFPYETRLECKDPSKSRSFGDIQAGLSPPNPMGSHHFPIEIAVLVHFGCTILPSSETPDSYQVDYICQNHSNSRGYH